MGERQDARRRLGLRSDASDDEVARAFAERRIEVATQLDRTESAGELQRLREALTELDALAPTIPMASDGAARGSDAYLPTELAPTTLDPEGLATTGALGGARPPIPAQPADDEYPLLGTTLVDRYELVGTLGRGGMSAVYLAKDSRGLTPTVAIKVLHQNMLEHGDARERFLREALRTRDLSHDNIIRVFDAEDVGEFVFITMEHLEGQTLRQAIVANRNNGIRWDLDDVFDIAFAMCSALSYAHRKLIHRDIKPSNVFLCSDGTVKLMDFGVARFFEDRRMTRSGFQPGTIAYMAPEQRNGKKIDHRADQYAVGLILYELVTGLSFGNVDIRKRIEGVPLRLNYAIARMLSEDPKSRFADMEAVKLELRTILQRWNRKQFWRMTRITTSVAAGLLLAGVVTVSIVEPDWLPWSQSTSAGMREEPDQPPQPPPDDEEPDSDLNEASTTVPPVDPPTPAPTLLELAADGDEGGVRASLDAGDEVDAVDGNGRTPLTIAAENGFVDIAALLIEGGANLEHRSRGMTPLLHAAWKGRQDVFELLVEAGAAPLAKEDGTGETALSLACLNEDLALVRTIVEVTERTHGREATARLIAEPDSGGRSPYDGASDGIRDYLREELRRLRE